MRRLAVLGQPISHSLSPAIHGAAIRALGLESEWSYEAIEIGPEGFAGLVRSLPASGFAGVNVTVPHKSAALEIADQASGIATAIGAANTLSFEGELIRAENTDAEGFLGALPRAPAGLRALVLGAGGAARAVVWALRNAGADVSIWNRTAERADALATQFGATVSRPATADQPLGISDSDLLVNATSVGLHPATEAGTSLKALQLDADCFHDQLIVVDLVYGPEQTELLRSARERGAMAIDGREVLVHQGAASFRIWTGVVPPIDTMREAAGLR